MLENLCSYLYTSFAFLVGNLFSPNASGRKKNRRCTVTLEGPEVFECRITPSTAVYWTATTAGDWNNAQNWTDENGNHVVPNQNSDVIFGQLTGNNDCTMSIPNGTTINSLTINATYGSHTITLNGRLTVDNGILMEAGNIAQPNGDQSSITCWGSLNWTGGTINSSATVSTLTINNEISTISEIATKTLGDNIQLNGELDLQGNNANSSGNELRLTNNANFTVGNIGKLVLNGGADGITNASGSNGVLTNNGVVSAVGATGSQNLESIPIVNIGPNSQLVVGDANGTATTLEITDSNPQNGVSVLNNGGTTTIYTGATFRPLSGFTQQGGTLEIGGTSGTAKLSGATAASSVVINGGLVKFDAAADNLLVSFNFTETAGGLQLTVDATALDWNTITSNAGSITIANPCTVVVNTINIPAGGMPTKQWPIFFSSNLFGVNASVTVGNAVNWVFNGFRYTLGGNGTQIFFLQS
ncbi:MAG TPA: hypothetical protein VH643_08435 [Gemmataceae bacterium]|jgi:hypothetical protein